MIPQAASLTFQPNPILQKFRHQCSSHISDWSKFLMHYAARTVADINDHHGIVLSAQDWEGMNWSLFREHDCQFQCVADHDVTAYSITTEGRTIHVLFSETGLCIVSALADLNPVVEKAAAFKESNKDWSANLNHRYDLYRLCLLDANIYTPVHQKQTRHFQLPHLPLRQQQHQHQQHQ